MSYFRSTSAGILAIVAIPANALAQQIPSFSPGYHMWGSGAGWFLGPMMMLLFLGLAAAVIALVIRWVFGIGQTSSGSQDLNRDSAPLDILKERFARGEIDKKEFEDRKKILKEG